jgi:hypothetical protein
MLAVAIYIGKAIIDPPIVAKLNTKHQVTQDELREALEWPAKVRVAREVHPVHGLRWIALARTATSREVIATLLPAPYWEGEKADTWVVKTARWV